MNRTRTCSLALALLGTLVGGSALPVTPAHADTLKIPAALYPHGARITPLRAPSNRTVDCDWGFECDERGIRRQSLFHTLSQDQLHRVGGWMQFAYVENGGHPTTFALILSHYGPGVDLNGHQWSMRAYEDLWRAAWLGGFRFQPAQSAVLMGIPAGQIRSGVWSRAGVTSVLVAYWNGQDEIEASTTYDARQVRKGRLVRTLLTLQVREAVGGLSSPGS
jgi:hypothetical protein